MNEFFAKVELLAGLSETEQTELRTNIGLNTIIDDLSNDTVTTKELKVTDEVLIDTSNLKLRLGERTSNMFLKSITADGKAAWSPLPTYDEMIGATMEAITQDLFEDLSELNNLRVENKLQLQCNVAKPSVIVNEDSNGVMFWRELQSNFDNCNLQSNEIPNMVALGALYDLTLSNNSNLYSNLYDVATDTSLVLTLSNNLSELSNNLPEIMSNLGMDLNFTTSNLLTSNVVASNIDTKSIVTDFHFSEQSRISNLLVHEDATITGAFQSDSVNTSNVSFSDSLIGNEITASNINVNSSIITTNVTTSNTTTSNISLKNIHFDMINASNNEILTIMNSNISFKKLNSDYLASSEDSIPSSKALNDALQFMDTRVRTITNDPTFAETYIQINCNLDEIKYYTVENMLKLHSNLRIAKLAREPTWENIENIPSDLANLSDFYLTKDLSNIDLGDINILKLRNSLALEEMAYQTNNEVDIRGGTITASRVEASNFLMTDSEHNIETDRINYRDETFLYMRHAGYEGENVPGTGKWGNLPIKQFYTDIGKNSIPSCDALSNLYTYMITNDRIVDDQLKLGYLNNSYSNQSSTSNAASTKALTGLYNYMRDNSGGDIGFLNKNYKNQSSHTNAATSKALSDLHSFMRSSDGGDSGFLNPEFKGQTSQANAATSKALSDLHDYMRSSTNEGFLNNEYQDQTSQSNAASTKALTDLYNYMRGGFVYPLYIDMGDATDTNAASAASVVRLHNFMRSAGGGDLGFMTPEYKGQSSERHAATTKALSDFHDFVRGSNGGDEGFLNTNYKDQTSHSNAASTKALSDLHDFLRSSDENGYLIPDFSNQTSHSNAATAKSVTDLFNYIIDGFLVKDFTAGNEETAATSGSVYNLYQYIRSSNFIVDQINDNSESKVVSAKALSNLYYQNLASEDFFKIHNSYIFEDYLKQSINDKSSTQPFSSTATSNIIHDMITERRKIYNALNDDGVLNNQINNNDFGKIATAQSVYYLSNNTRNELNKLNDSIYENLKDTDTNLSIFGRIGLNDSETNPLEILKTNNCNIDLGLKYNPKYFTLTGSGQFTLDDTAISNIAASAIKIRSSSDDGGFSNLIEVDPVADGEYEIKFRGTSLLDEISGDVAQSVADALLNYGEGDYTFSCNLFVKSNLTVDSNIRASNVYFSNVEVVSNLTSSDLELSNSLLVHGSANFESNVTILSNLTVSGDAMIEGYQKISSTLSVSENMYVDDELQIFSNAFIGGKLSVREDLVVGGSGFIGESLSVSGDLFSESIETASNAIIHGELSVHKVTMSNLDSKNIDIVNAQVQSNLTFNSEYHNVKVYATNPDGSFGNNNLYLEANNVDKIVYSNIRDIVLGEEQSRIYIGGELSVMKNSVYNLNVSGPSVFDEVISGTINNTEHVLADKAVESSMTDQRYFPMSIDRTDGDAPFKELHPFSNMYFDKNLNVNIDTGLSVKNTITSGELSVSQLNFDTLGGSVEVHGQNIRGTVPNASNVAVNRIISETDASYYNLSMVKYDLTHDVLQRKNRTIEFGTDMVYQPSENLLSVGKLSAENGYNIGKINAAALSTGSPVDLNPYINITQDNLLKVDANLSVAYSGESTLANTISVAQKNNTGGYDEQLVFANQEDGLLTVRPDITFEVDGLDYGIKVNTTKILNNQVSASEIHANTLKVGNTSNDPLYINSDGLVDAREVSAGRLIIQEGSEFSGAGKPGELKFASGKFYGHDGTKFTSISSATVNDEETGMFVTEGKHDIDFRCTSNGTPFDFRLQSNLVNIPNTLSVKDVYVYDNTVVKSLILRDNIRQKKFPLIQMTQNEMSGYIASGSSTLSFQNDFYKCFDGKDVSYDDFDDGTGHYSAWISQTTYDHVSGLPLVDASPTFPGTEKRGEFCMLKLPSPILLKQFHIYTRGSATYENATPPKNICLYGTNNGTDWEELGSYKDLIFTGREGLRLEVDIIPVQSTTTVTQLGSDLRGDAESDQFGWSVVLSTNGTRMAVGGRLHDNTSTNEGHVRVYDYEGNQWVQVGQDIDGEADNDRSGNSLAMSSDGSRIAISAPNHDSGRGQVRIFDYVSSTSQWTQVGQDIDGESSSDQSGITIAMSSDGTRVAIGAPAHDGGRGHVRVYNYSGSQWVQVGSDIDGEALSDQYRNGFLLSENTLAMSSDGTRIAVGAIYNDGNGGNSGHVRVYDYSGSQWVQVGSDIDGEASGDSFGWSVAISSDGARIAVGAIYNDGNGGNSGHVRVYDYSGSQWVQVGSDIDGEASGDSFGWSVAISSDGARIAVGAINNAGNGGVSGPIRVYDYSGSQWVQVGNDIDNEASWSVAMSSDGARIAVGSPYNDDNGTNSGMVRVYHVSQDKYKKFNQFAIQVECITVQGNKPAYCAIGRLDFYTQDDSATYTDLDDRLEGLPGQLVYSDGKILCHDGTSFKQITGSTANMDRTGMFLVEGESNIKFRVNSDSNATDQFDVKIEEDKAEFGSNVIIQNDLSVGGITTFSGHMIPSATDAFDIGSVDNAVRDLFISDNSLWVGDTTKISFTNGKMKFRKRKRNIVPAAILNAGLSKGHANHQATKTAALQHAGVSSLEEMKLAHWARYMRTLQPQATVGDIFRRDHDEDYEVTASSESWYEIDDTKVYTSMAVGINTSDPEEALHVNGKIRVEDGFSLIKQGSDSNETNPALVIDTNFFGADTEVVDRTSAGITSFTKLFRIYGRTSEGVGRSWHWGIPNDDSAKLGLAWDGGGTPDPDLGFVFTTNGDFYANQFHGTLKGHADTATSATRLTTAVTINGIPFDGTQSIDVAVADTSFFDDLYIRRGSDLFASFNWDDSTELDKRYIRKDTDSVASFAWAKSDTPNIKLQNSTHSTWLYLGGADGGTNTDNIARIRSASAGDLVVDSAANANLYLNWHSSGMINLGGYTKVRGHFCVTGDAPNTGYHLILNGLRPTTTEGGAVHFINGPNRSEDGGVNTYTIRNDSGNLRLGRSGSTTRIEGNVEFESFTTNTTVGNIDTRLTTVENAGYVTASGLSGYNFATQGYVQTAVAGASGGVSYTEADINAPAATSGTWTTSDNAGYWGEQKFNAVYNKYAYGDAGAYRQYSIPSGMKSAYISHLQWSNGGYTDIHGVQSDGDLVFLRRINTHQTIENTDEGDALEHDGHTISFAGTGLQSYSAIRFTVKSGRFHLSGLGFVPHLDGTEGTGMVNGGQITQPSFTQSMTVSNGDSSTTYYGPNSKWSSYLLTGSGTNQIGTRSDLAQVLSTNGSLQLDAGVNREIYLNYYAGRDVFFCNGAKGLNGAMKQNGNLGLGTTTPGYKLEVNGTSKFNGEMRWGLGHTSHAGYSTNKDWYIRSGSSSGKVIIQDTGGNVGIGTASPSAKLDVHGGGLRVSGYELTSYQYPSINSGLYPGPGYGGTKPIAPFNTNFSAYFTGMTRAPGYVAFSDQRIKSNVVDISDTTALDQLRQLQPKYYEYIDKVGKGSSTVIGFIAQEVKEVVPQAVSIADGDIPNIYETAKVSANTLTFTNFDTSNLDGTNNMLIVYEEGTKRKELTVVEVVDEHTIRVDTEVSGENVFVWGQVVDDFHHINKDYLWTVATAALQEVDRQLQAEKEKVRLLESKLESTESTLASVLERLTALEN